MSTIDGYTYPPAPDLRAAAFDGPAPGDHWALREMSWCQEHFGFAIAEAGRGGPLDRYAVFTVGLTLLGQELVVIGQPPETARQLITAVVQRMSEEDFFLDEFFDDLQLATTGVTVEVRQRGRDSDSDRPLVTRIAELPLEREHALFPGGLFRHPEEDRRSSMLLIHLELGEEADAVVPPASTTEPTSPQAVVARHFDEVVRAEKEMFDRVWYHRSLQHEYDLRDSGDDAEVDRFLAIASSGRSRVEATYTEPGHLGPYTDFELGMLNGKLSALRWVLGSEWDFLDT